MHLKDIEDKSAQQDPIKTKITFDFSSVTSVARYMILLFFLKNIIIILEMKTKNKIIKANRLR